MPFDKKTYDAEYHRTNIFQKKIPFNRTQPEDIELLAFLDRKPNATKYLKDLIRREMEKEAAPEPEPEPGPEPEEA